MSHSNPGHVALHALKDIAVSVLKILAIACGMVIKVVGIALTKIGELTLKIADK